MVDVSWAVGWVHLREHTRKHTGAILIVAPRKASLFAVGLGISMSVYESIHSIVF